ncbi:MAG: glycosyltransferase [Syntrophobacteraceae bacterium]
MKIVLTVHQFLPEYTYGTEIIACNIARELRSRGHEISIVTGFDAKTPLADEARFGRYEYEGFPVHRFLHACVPMGGQDDVVEIEYNNRLFYGWFRNYLSDCRPDVVHFVHMGRLSASAVDACVEMGVPAVFTATDFWPVCPTNQLLLPDGSMCGGPDALASNCLRHIVAITQPALIRTAVERLPDPLLESAIRLCRKVRVRYPERIRNVASLASRLEFIRQRMNLLRRIVVPSRIMGEVLARCFPGVVSIVHLPYGIDVRRIPRLNGKGERAALRLGFVGRIQESKGLHVLVRAVRSLESTVPVELKIHGNDGEHPEYVRALRRTADGDPRIGFCGPFENGMIGEVLRDVDVLVCPSVWYENTPLVIREAQAAGCPVIASNLPGMAEAIEPGVDGMLFDPGNSGDLAAVLRRLEADRPLVSRLSSGTGEPLSVSDHVDALERIYEEILPAHGGKKRGAGSARGGESCGTFTAGFRRAF